MRIKIKNMVCDRCIMVVGDIAKNLALPVKTVTLGEIDFAETALKQTDIDHFEQAIKKVGFEVIADKKSLTVESIKAKIINYVNIEDEFERNTISSYLSKAINYDYNHLSRVFSEQEGITIEQYVINQKIEKAKELISYQQDNLTTISQKLGYSSLAHFSNQFKKVMGTTPSQFKKQQPDGGRKAIDKV